MDALSAQVPGVSRRATAVAHCWVLGPVHQELLYQAQCRREHQDALAAKILTAVLVLGIADELIQKADAALQIG